MPAPPIASREPSSSRAAPAADWFLLGLAAAVALAWIFPEPGSSGGLLRPEVSNKAGVALVFFLHGLTLSFSALRAGTLSWRVHLVIQASTFVLFPLTGLLALWLFGGALGDDLALGFFYLCALPSTVSSSIALTAAAGGNIAVAMFNATLSSVLGVFLTPFWVGLVAGASGEGLPLGKVVLDLVLWLLVPLCAGQVLTPWVGAFARRHKRAVSFVDRATILLLVYTSFCESVSSGVWNRGGAGVVLKTLVASAALLLVALTAVSFLTRAAGFAEPDRIAAIFCGSKKTLASGVPMARLIFGADPRLSVILLPILIYHPLQLVVCGWLAGRWARRNERAPVASVSA